MKTGRPFTAALIVLGVSTSACADLTEPPSASASPARPASEVAAARPAPTPAPTPTPAPAPVPDAETVTASHILIQYQGAMRAPPTIVRSKDAAKTRAAEILARAQKGEDFGKLAEENSEDPSAKKNQGSLGTFTRQQMVKEFSDVAFALKPGQLSTVVETPFGFHIIKRFR